MMKIVERAALLIEDKLATGCAGYGEGVRAEVTIDHAAELLRRHRRVDLRLQGLHLKIGLLKFERRLLQLLISALELLSCALDPRIFCFELLNLYFKRPNYFVVAFALLAQLAHLTSDFLHRGGVSGVAVGSPSQAG